MKQPTERVRVYGEMYTSRAFLESQRELLESPPEPGCRAPRAIIALMFWSDETQLTSFGQAKLWPLYMYLGNNSKYQRVKPTSNLCSHVAYFQQVRPMSFPRDILLTQRVKLPDSFIDFASAFTGRKGPTEELIAHCKREAFHAQWEVLLDDEFTAAWKHGILTQGGDGITRRVYPRIFTYSADYPEK